MPGVIHEIDPTSEDASNVSLVMVDNTSYFLLSEDWPAPEVDQPMVSSVSTEGELPVTARHRNTTGTSTYRVVGSTAADLQTKLNYIDKKLAKVMREGGTLKRTTPSGATYVTDLIAGSAAFAFTRRYTASNICEVSVTWPRRPYWRQTPITLSSHTETALPALIFTEGGPPSVGSYSGTLLALTPALYWRLGDTAGSGTAADSSGNARNGTVGSGVTLGVTGALSGDADTAASLNNTTNAKITSSYSPFAGDFTIMGWFWRNATTDADTLWGASGTAGPFLRCDSASSNITFDNDGTSGAGALAWTSAMPGTGQWVFIALTFNSSTFNAELFINGSSQGTKAFAAIGASPGNFQVGLRAAATDPFNGLADEVAIFTSVMSASNILAVYNAGLGVFGSTSPIKGDVPALGRLVVTEAQAQDQFWLTYGLQSRYYSSSADAALYYEAETRTPLGAGAATAVGPTGASGGGSNTILANNLGTVYQAIMSTQASGGGNHLSHIGDYQVYARVQTPTANSGAVTIALDWAVGDFLRHAQNADSTLPSLLSTGGTWRLVNLGLISIPKVATGTQRWEGRLLAKSTVAGDDIYVDCLMLVPVTEGLGIAKGVGPSQSASTFVARDEFDQTAGALTGKTAPIGGVWSGGGDTDDFSVETTGKTATRSIAAADGSTGRVVWLPQSMTSCAVQVDVKTSSLPSTFLHDQSAAARVVDASNFAAATLTWADSSTGAYKLQATRVIAGVERIMGSLTLVSLAPGQWYTIRFVVDAAGRWWAGYAQQGQTISFQLSGQDSTLATGGTLASGNPGIREFQHTNTSSTRNYDNFAAWAVTPDAAVFASRQAEIRNDRVIRQDSAGAVWATPSSFQGDYLLVPCSGREGRTTQFIVKASRNDPATMPDSSIDDITAQLVYTPRFLTLPE